MTEKKKLEVMYKTLEKSLNVDGDWERIADSMEHAIIKVLGQLNDMINETKN